MWRHQCQSCNDCVFNPLNKKIRRGYAGPCWASVVGTAPGAVLARTRLSGTRRPPPEAERHRQSEAAKEKEPPHRTTCSGSSLAMRCFVRSTGTRSCSGRGMSKMDFSCRACERRRRDAPLSADLHLGALGLLFLATFGETFHDKSSGSKTEKDQPSRPVTAEQLRWPSHCPSPPSPQAPKHITRRQGCAPP